MRALALTLAAALFLGAAHAEPSATATAQIVQSLTPGFTTRLTYPAALVCPKSLTNWMPEIATRVASAGSAHPTCRVDEHGRLSGCTKDEEAGTSDLYFPTGAAFMAQQCRLGTPPASPVEIQFEFTYETKPR